MLVLFVLNIRFAVNFMPPIVCGCEMSLHYAICWFSQYALMYVMFHFLQKCALQWVANVSGKWVVLHRPGWVRIKATRFVQMAYKQNLLLIFQLVQQSTTTLTRMKVSAVLLIALLVMVLAVSIDAHYGGYRRFGGYGGLFGGYRGYGGYRRGYGLGYGRRYGGYGGYRSYY